jgi:formimidoylglutamate deiminase
VVTIRAEHCLTQDGWRSPAFLAIDDRGFITSIESTGIAEASLAGITIPGIPNLHSHAFQRAMVGATERRDPAQTDTFWTWRTKMYELAHAVTPDDLSAIAEMLFVEMLEAGMTAVGEFHYLHHGPNGAPYADPAETSLRILAAAEATGIAITHLPVLYLHGGFDKPILDRQRRFASASVEAFLAILESSKRAAQSNPLARVGIAPHSLRAVMQDELQEVIAAVGEDTPIHIHVAEQQLEVAESIAALGARPVRWLIEEIGIDERWCLVHATHVDEEEIQALARSEAVVGLCPTTEANLGDGIFPAVEYLEAGGRFGLGSDSHVTVDPAEELRLLEYGQRLVHQERNLLGGILERAAIGGALALAQPSGSIAIGRRADLIVLDADHPRLVGRSPDGSIDAWLFGSARGAVKEVWVAGKRVVDGRHPRHDEVARRYAEVARRLGG